METTCCGKSAVKKLNLIKHPMFGYEYVILFILITKQSPVMVFSAPKEKNTQNQNGHCLVKMTRHEKICVPPPLFSKPNIIFQFFFR